jgi:hypothetical protein
MKKSITYKYEDQKKFKEQLLSELVIAKKKAYFKMKEKENAPLN